MIDMHIAKKHICGFRSVVDGLDVDGLYLRCYQAQNDRIIIPSKLFCFPSDLTTEYDGSEGQYTQNDAACIEIWDPGMIEIGNSQQVFRIARQFALKARWRYEEFDPISIEPSRSHGRNGSQFARRKTLQLYHVCSERGRGELVTLRRGRDPYQGRARDHRDRRGTGAVGGRLFPTMDEAMRGLEKCSFGERTGHFLGSDGVLRRTY